MEQPDDLINVGFFQTRFAHGCAVMGFVFRIGHDVWTEVEYGVVIVSARVEYGIESWSELGGPCGTTPHCIHRYRELSISFFALL